MTWSRRLPHGYELSTDRSRLDLGMITDFLSGESYWAAGRPADVIRTSIDNSLTFGLFAPAGAQVGLTRVVTDGATFGWVCDVFVLGRHRGNGLGKAMLAAVLEHPEVAPVRRLLLATADAHGLYRQHGFTSLHQPDRWMERRSPAFDLPG